MPPIHKILHKNITGCSALFPALRLIIFLLILLSETLERKIISTKTDFICHLTSILKMILRRQRKIPRKS